MRIRALIFEPVAETRLRRVLLALLLALICPAAVQGAEEPTPVAAVDEAGSGDNDPEGAPEEANADADSDADAARASIDERLDALLKEALPEDEYREERRCLTQRSYRSVEVLSTEYLLFYKNNTYWINRLSRPCPMLKFDDVPVFQHRGTTSLCERDAFYPTNRMDLGRGFDASGRPLISSGVCFLGTFEEINPEQAALLRGR